ncbi:MAG: TonB-dependent receptor domain-containing protein [Bryobacteraceae bacterium]
MLRRFFFVPTAPAVIAALVLFHAVLPMQGQVTTATFYGTITDPSGASVSGANVRLTNQSTGVEILKTTGEGGDFAFNFLQIGTYQLKIEHTGFKTIQSKAIELSAGQNVRRNFTLDLGAITETVSVEAAAPLVNAVSAEQRQNVSMVEASQLPLSKRNVGGLLGLGTGASAGGGFVRLNGVGKAGTLFTVDGTSATADPESRTTSMRGNFEQINLVSLESVQEVETTKGVLPAEYGQVLGGNVNIITTSGTNQYHGSAFENFQNSFLNSRLQFLSTIPNAVFNQFGGSIGGPIKRDKIFFFADYEGYRQSITQVVSGTVLTPNFRQTLLTAVPAYGHALEGVPLPNQPFASGADLGLYIGSGQQRNTDDHFDGKGDIHLTSNSNLSLSYTHGRPYQSTPRIFSNNPQIFHGFIERGTANYITGGPSWTSETRFGYNLNDMDRTDQYFLDGIPETIPYGGRSPQLSYIGFNSPAGELYLVEGRTWSLEEKYAKSIGKHNIKFGGIYMRYNVFRTNPQNATVNYATRTDLLANTPAQTIITFGNGIYDASNYTLGFFAQDNWKISKTFSLDIGVRYDFFSKYVAHSRTTTQDYALYNLNGLIDNRFNFGPVRDPNDPYNSDAGINLAPRLGFSWDPNGKGQTTIRGGAGIMFSPMAVGMFTGAVGSRYLPFRVTLSRQEAINNRLQFPIYNDQVATIIQAQQRVQPSSIFNPNLQSPYVGLVYFGVQHAITSSLVFETAFVGNRGLKYPLARLYNQPDRVTGVRLNPNLNQGYYIDNSQQSWYSSWQNTLRKRFSHNFTFAVHYTWAKQLATETGDISAYYQNNTNARVQNFFNLRPEWGPADGDITHYFNADWVYSLPTLASVGNSFVKQAFGGWQFSGIVAAATGQPLLITEGSADNVSRPDYVANQPGVNPNYLSTLQYINKAAFTAVPISSASGLPIRPGNISGAFLRGPGYWNADLSVGKNFSILEKLKLQLRLDALNALNHTNLTSFNQDVLNANFGRFTNTRGARVLQLNGRFTW